LTACAKNACLPLFVATSNTKVNPQEPTVAVVEEMPRSLPPLKNHYYLLRHGQSTANVQGIISSARSLAGSDKHGLTLLGIEQGRNSASPLMDLVEKDLNADDTTSTKQLYFYSSPFARAKETSYACLEGLRTKQEVGKRVMDMGLTVNEEVFIHDGLMERYFGRLDGKELLTYAYVWPVDMFDPTHTAFDVESVAAVSERMRATLLDIDSQHDEGGNHIVLTSHADVLQITQAYAAGLDNVGMFSQYRFLNGEVRKMGRAVDTLPEAVPLKAPKGAPERWNKKIKLAN
jgi:broad specificity phosphatase PhoE